jgi:hypothetical protein
VATHRLDCMPRANALTASSNCTRSITLIQTDHRCARAVHSPKRTMPYAVCLADTPRYGMPKHVLLADRNGTAGVSEVQRTMGTVLTQRPTVGFQRVMS